MLILSNVLKASISASSHLIIKLMSTATSQRPAVRHARPGDAAALIDLQAEIYGEGRWFVGDGPPSAATLERRLRAFSDEMTLYLVALPPKGEVCAWLELHRLTPKRLTTRRHAHPRCFKRMAAARGGDQNVGKCLPLGGTT